MYVKVQSNIEASQKKYGRYGSSGYSRNGSSGSSSDSGTSETSGWWPETKKVTLVDVYDREGYTVARNLSMEEAHSLGAVSDYDMLKHVWDDD